MDKQKLVIVGGGLAAANLIKTLRRKKFSGTIALISEEGQAPYDRPPLSKKFLLGQVEADTLTLLEDLNGLNLRKNTKVARVDSAAKQVELCDGQRLDYDMLVLATGGRPRKLKIPGDQLEGIHYLRSLADADGLRHELKKASSVVVVGAGFIGLEVAACARTLGKDVTCLEAGERPLGPLPAQVGEWFADLHRQRGVRFHFNQKVEGFQGQSRVTAVQTANELVETDLVVVGVGILPNQELLEGCDLKRDDGIWVDSRCRTADESIFAIGDVARVEHPRYGPVRLEHWESARQHGQVAALNIVGKDAHWDQLPYFWSDQYDSSLQVFGHASPDARSEMEGSPDEDHFRVVSFDEDDQPSQIVLVNQASQAAAALKRLQ